MASATPLPARPDVPIHRDAFVTAMLVVSLLGAGMLFALWGVAQTMTTDQVGVGSALNATAAVVDEHAGAMVDHGNRLLAAAQRGTGDDREHWISDAQHMIADGNGLRALAERLRVEARLLGESPSHYTNASAGTFAAKAQALRAAGQAAIEHGRAMIEHGDAMAELARQPGSSVSSVDADLMRSDSPRIVDAGERVVRVAEMLAASADQLRGLLRR